MKSIKSLLFSFLFLIATAFVSHAQTNIPFTNSGFEEWTTGSGYSIMVGPIPLLPVYGDFTYPSNWNYPSFPIDYPINYSGMSLNINTDLPLLKVAQETSGVPEGNTALKMESFKLSDIISSGVYSLFQSYIDEELADMVIPTFLTTGEINMEQLFTLLSTFTENSGDLSQMLANLSELDMNEYIAGGIPLNGEIIGSFTGQYKYTSATSGDNGGVLIFGTKYNTTTHRREVVGGGFAMSLTDVTNYTPFEVTYSSLGEMVSGQPLVNADSLVIVLCSSANADNRQQGSALYVDNLQLWTSNGNRIPTFSGNDMLCFPNPANGQCQLQFQQKPLSVKLYSIDGKLLQQTTPQSENVTLELPYKGVFILHSETDHGIITRKIVNQ